MDLLELNERMLGLRETYRKEIKSYTKKLFVNLVYFYEDLYTVAPALYEVKMKEFGDFFEIYNKENHIQGIAGNVALNLSDRLKEAMNSSEYNPVYDISSSLQIFPLKDKILFTFYGTSSLEQILEKEPDIEEYHYQNQSDMPEDMSEEEWEQRRIDWERAMPSGIPAKNGFGVELIVPTDIPLRLSEWLDNNDYEKYKKPLEKRTASIAECCYKEEGGLKDKTGLEKYTNQIMDELSKTEDPVYVLYEQYYQLPRP